MEMRGATVLHSRKSTGWIAGSLLRIFAAALISALLIAWATTSLLPVRAGGADRIPSYVEWSAGTIASASSGDAFRGSLLARKCAHCHGDEGFSPVASTPNLVAMDKLSVWKQLQDFRSGKRGSRVMAPIAQSLAVKDLADLAAYYATLPVFTDFQDNRAFPQAAPGAGHVSVASRLITFGDGERGIPPCQACHGPVAFRPGAPSLTTQNADYVLEQLEEFASGARANDIDEPMRTIAGLLSDDERHALAEYYGAGLGRAK
jgi:cytochrome c553